VESESVTGRGPVESRVLVLLLLLGVLFKTELRVC